jgi:predicted DCC family thiol-disulfide oxidoreductase YuxK
VDSRTPSTPTLIFDGDCGFCKRSARWIASGWPPDRAEAVSWQTLGPHGLEELGLSEADVRAAAWWIDAGGRPWRGHQAVARSLQLAKGWRRATGLGLMVPPLSWLARPGYYLVARYRYRLPGGSPACRVDEDRAAGWP